MWRDPWCGCRKCRNAITYSSGKGSGRRAYGQRPGSVVKNARNADEEERVMSMRNVTAKATMLAKWHQSHVGGVRVRWDIGERAGNLFARQRG